jgi:DNA-binding ferritin-like protein
VSSSGREDPAAALNRVLSEVIDGVLDVHQAHRRVPETHALHAELDRLFADLRSWAGLLADQDQALGVSPLASGATAAGRKPPHPWHGTASDEEVSQILGEDLGRLGRYVTAALAEQPAESVRAVLTEIQRGLQAHRQALSEF